MNDWKKQFEDDFKRKDWMSPQWMKSKDDLDRLVWLISSYSPHNLWKAKQNIRDFIDQEIKRTREEVKQEILDLLPEEREFRDWWQFDLGWNAYRKTIIEKIEKL